jgi:hypothetical protein
MSEQLTPESMREWEERLGPEKVKLACDILRSHGWRPDDRPPMWVWQEAYLMAEGRRPIQWGTWHGVSIL